MEHPKTPALTKATVTNWLKSDVTFTAPGWAFALAAVAALVLLGIALD
ncbi:hypothetical protein [Roseobacter sp. CCS2]|nr:hypothetical protein [Roseobacter sp. CCS2]EBA11668.1 hypothetical protein RCCS2_17106 [Roseobacter sp. CCS2]